jgi:hypothetical protein
MYIICVFFVFVGYLDPTLGEFSVACRDKLIYVYVYIICTLSVYFLFFVGYLDPTLGKFSVACRDKRAV